MVSPPPRTVQRTFGVEEKKAPSFLDRVKSVVNPFGKLNPITGPTRAVSDFVGNIVKNRLQTQPLQQAGVISNVQQAQSELETYYQLIADARRKGRISQQEAVNALKELDKAGSLIQSQGDVALAQSGLNRNDNLNFAQRLASTGSSVGQDITRFPFQVFTSVVNSLPGGDIKLETKGNKFLEGILGKEDIEGLRSEARRQFGSDSNIATIAVIGFGALDYVSGGGASLVGKKTFAKLLRTADPEEAKLLLKGAGLVDDIPEAQLDNYAKLIANASTKKDLDIVLQGVEKEIKSIKPGIVGDYAPIPENTAYGKYTANMNRNTYDVPANVVLDNAKTTQEVQRGLFQAQDQLVEHSFPTNMSGTRIENTGDIYRELAKGDGAHSSYIADKLSRLKGAFGLDDGIPMRNDIADILDGRIKPQYDKEMGAWLNRLQILKRETNRLPDGPYKQSMLDTLDLQESIAKWYQNPSESYGDIPRRIQELERSLESLKDGSGGFVQPPEILSKTATKTAEAAQQGLQKGDVVKPVPSTAPVDATGTVPQAAVDETALPQVSKTGSYYHETDPVNAMKLAQGITSKKGLNVASDEGLALGQGGKGVVVEVELRP